MAAPRYVHLRLHSEYSVTDGIVRIDEAVARAASDGMPALAITDAANVFGMVKFYKAARAAGVKPILGADCWIQNDSDRDKPHRVALLCASHAGYLRLSELLSRAWLTNQHRARAEISRAWLEERSTDGLIALSGAGAGDVGQALAAGNADAAHRLARGWQALFPGRYYVELQRAGLTHGETLVARSVELASQLGLPVVATHPVQFLDPGDFKAHEARVCIAQGYVLGDQRRPRLFTPEQHFKTQEEMALLFADIPQALENSVEIARRCNLEIELGRSRLPAFPTPPGVTLDDFLAQQAQAGLAARLQKLFSDPGERGRQAPRYVARLEFEIATIVQMGFAGYFLIVADFINWAKTNGVPVGPGRGSGAGSLVAYSLGITDLDPLKYDLLFERFLNPERVSMPDFDIDFCQDGRDKVINYVRQRYGEDSVSQIATFGTMAARAVVRDTGRVLDLGYNFCDQIAKLIPFQPGRTITLEDAREMEPLLAEREQKEDEVRELLELGEKLEGLTRNVGMHAGGVLIAPGKLTDFCPLYAAEGTTNVISQLDKDDVEAIGLVKFDFLGLTTLTILDWAERYVRGLGQDDFSLDRIPLDDPETYELLSSGNTTAVFQLESRGMRDLIKRARPDRFEDIIALVALYRPGPMDLIPDFIARKHGQQRVEYLDSRLEPILGPTYGIMVYQEQVMQIAQVIGGYTLGGSRPAAPRDGKEEGGRDGRAAGHLRFGRGKERPVEGQGNAAVRPDGEIRGLRLQQVACRRLRAGRVSNRLHEEAPRGRLHGGQLLGGDGRHGQGARHSRRLPRERSAHPGAGRQRRFVPLRAGRQADDSLRPWRDPRHGRIRGSIDRRGAKGGSVPRPVRLLPAGRQARGEPARDRGAGAGRRVRFRRAEPRQRSRDGRPRDGGGRAGRAAGRSGQPVRRRRGGPRRCACTLASAPWDEKQKLMEEKAALGFCLSGHLFSVYQRELANFPRLPLAKVKPTDGRPWLAGIVASARNQMTRRGRMMVVVLDDGTAQLEVTVFNELYDKHREKLKEDSLLVVQGKVQRDEFSGGFRITAEELLDLAAVRERFAARLRLDMNGQADARRLAELLSPYRGSGGGACSVFVHYVNESASCDVALGEAWRVRLDAELLEQLSRWLTPENVHVVYANGAAT